MKNTISAVESAAHKKIEASLEVMKNAGVSYDSWCMMLFETGCDFVEKWITGGHLQLCLLQNEKIGFWSWWTVMWMDGDKEMLSARISNSDKYYINKRGMLEIKSVYDEFLHFLNRKNIAEVNETIM